MGDYRDPRFDELDRLIYDGVGHLPPTVIARLSRTELYKFRRRAHPRHLSRRIEPWEVRRQKYLVEKALPEFAETRRATK